MNPTVPPLVMAPSTARYNQHIKVMGITLSTFAKIQLHHHCLWFPHPLFGRTVIPHVQEHAWCGTHIRKSYITSIKPGKETTFLLVQFKSYYFKSIF